MSAAVVILGPALLVNVATTAMILTGAPLTFARRYPLARLTGYSLCFAGWTIWAVFRLISHDWRSGPVAAAMAVWDLYWIWKMRPEVR